MSSTSPTEGIGADTPTQRGLVNLLPSESEDVIVINPTVDVFRTVVANGEELEEYESVRVLATEETMKDIRRDFVLATEVHDLVNEDTVELRVCNAIESDATLAVSGSTLGALVTVPGRLLQFEHDESAAAEEATDAYREYWEEADEWSFRRPPLGVIDRTLEDEYDEGFRDDVDMVMSLLTESDQIDNTDIDATIVFMLVAAKHKELLYGISKWGEDTGVASKATFSRAKTRVEDLGLIDTEKVPIDVGRPRLRLTLSSEFDDETTDEIAQAVIDIFG